MAMLTIEAVIGRLDGLERENRRLRRVAGGLLVGVAVLGAMAVFGPDRAGRTLVAERLVIRDREGRVRGSFGLDRSGLPGLKIFDKRGLEQIELGIPSEDTSTLSFSDRGSNRFLLDTSIEGSAVLRMVDRDRREKAGMFIRPDGTSGFRIAQGDEVVTLRLGPDGRPVVLTTDDSGREVERPTTAKPVTAPTAPAIETTTRSVEISSAEARVSVEDRHAGRGVPH